MKSINFDHISANPLLPEVKEAMIEAKKRITIILPASIEPARKQPKLWKKRVNLLPG